MRDNRAIDNRIATYPEALSWDRVRDRRQELEPEVASPKTVLAPDLLWVLSCEVPSKRTVLAGMQCWGSVGKVQANTVTETYMANINREGMSTLKN